MEIRGDYRDLGIAVTFDTKTNEVAYSLAEAIAKIPTTYLLTERYIPHMTLSQGRIPRDHSEQLLQEVKNTSEQLSSIGVTFNQIYVRPNGNIFWLSEKVDPLQQAHLQLQRVLHSLSNGLLLDQFSTLLQNPTSSIEDQEQIRRFGIVLAGDRFLPHITLARLAHIGDKDKLDIATALHRAAIQTLIVGEIDDSGQIPRDKTIDIILL